MRYLELLLIGFLLHGCSGQQMAESITKTQIALAGNKPPSFFKIANLKTMRGYVFDMKHYTIALPEAKASDFIGIDAYGNKKAWRGGTYYSKDITLYLEGYYHIDISTDYYPQEVGEMARAIDRQDYSYLERIKKEYNYSPTSSLSYEIHGKENYKCMVKQRISQQNGYKTAYFCYKFNPSKTKAQSVTIVLTYSKPIDPKLAKIYTYEDLKQRAKRMLDSLYIKSWW